MRYYYNYLIVGPRTVQRLAMTTEYLRLQDRRKAEGRKNSGKSRTAQRVNWDSVPSLQSNSSLTVSAMGPNVFQMAQDHIVCRENTQRIHHLCH